MKINFYLWLGYIFLIYFALNWITFTSIHEVGHGIICIASGGSAIIGQSGTKCDPTPSGLYFDICGFAGGFFSALIAFTIWTIMYKKSDSWRYTATLLLIPTGAYELLNGLFEGCSYQLYQAYLRMPNNSLISFTIHAGLFILVCHHNKKNVLQEAENFFNKKNKRRDIILGVILVCIICVSYLLYSMKFTIQL